MRLLKSIKTKVLVITLGLALVSCEEEKRTLFTRISSEESGIQFNNRIIETDSFNIITSEYIFNGGGVGIGDFNNDERPDLFFTGNQVGNQLYLNLGGFKFKNISADAGIEAKDQWSTGVSVIDINDDSLLDVYVCAAMLPEADKKANLLFVNQGIDDDGIPKFKEMARRYGIADTGNSMASTFLDYDKDGHLDLYVLNNVDIHEMPTNYRKKITDGSALSNDRLFHNNGNGTFSDVTIAAGITIEGYGLGIAAADLNYDGWTDLYVSNDYLSNDIMYINNRDGTFTDRIGDRIKHQSKFSMGNDISDFNNDGHPDIITLDMLGETNQRLKTTIGNNKYSTYILNEKFDYDPQYIRNMLQMGNGPDLPYSEIGLMAGVARTDWSWSPLFVDADNDGLRDLLITNGFPRDITDMDFGEFKFNVQRFLGPDKILDSIPVVKIPNYAYKNIDDGRFEDVGESWGLNLPSFSNGAAFADLDGDGDMDYVTNNINEEAFVFENTLDRQEGGNHNFLMIELVGPETNTSGLGAKLTVRFEDDGIQYYEHRLNRGYMSSVHDIVHFGIGKRDQAKSMEILWPDGKIQKLTDVKGNRKFELRHSDAKTFSDSALLAFPFTPRKTDPIFAEIAEKIGIDYIHKEKDVIDFDIQRILPHKMTQNGPCLVAGDINGDGAEDFIVGSSHGYSPQVFLQQEDGTFVGSSLFEDEGNKRYEEEALALFDLENDGDQDLYLVSGSNEFTAGSDLYGDRLMINDGNGNFSISTDKMPEIRASGSSVQVGDFDDDGYEDLFIGGRTPYARYPLSENSYLLKNNAGRLEDVTESLAPDLMDIGMVNDAVWADLNGDGTDDLVVAGEFMPITIFENHKSEFQIRPHSGLDSLSGWWGSLIAEDFDKDGDIDLVAGNLGANNLYQPSSDKPVTMLAKDFDDNGNIDPVMFAYFKNSFSDSRYRSFPVHFWGDLGAQSPLFRSKFNYYREYAEATQSTLLNEEELSGALQLEANYDRTAYFENQGNGSFKHRQLPWQVQLAPINDMAKTDFNDDGDTDLLLIGNDFGNEIFVGRYDAFNGSVLLGDGSGGFEAIDPKESGFVVTGDAKDMVVVKNAADDNRSFYVVTQNRGKIQVFQRPKNNAP